MVAPFYKPVRRLVEEIEAIAAASACFKHQLCILAEIAATAYRELVEEGERDSVEYDQTFVSRVKVLEHILNDARDAAQHAASRHFLRVIWSREDPALALAAQFDATLEDIQALELGLGIQSGNIATRNEAARAADEGQRQNLLLAATRDYTLLESLLRLDECSPQVVVSAMQKQLERTSDVFHQRFLRRGIDAIQTKKGITVSSEPWLITSFEVDIGERLGTGGFSDIHVGQWRGSQVAVKVLKPGHASVAASEIQIWEKLRHPHVLQLFGASTIDSPPFLVMPLMKHGNLREYLKTHHQADRERLAHEIALGVEYLHTQSIVHGDLKAVNVLIDASETAVIADFGLSRNFGSIEVGAAAGTCALRWMAPERIKSKGPATTQGDIYSWGITAFELWTGLIPYQGMDDETIAWLVVERRQRPTRTEDIPESAWSLMSLCWSGPPAHRPTASQLTSRTSNLLAQRQVARTIRSKTSMAMHQATATKLSPSASTFGGQSIVTSPSAPYTSGSAGSGPASALFSNSTGDSSASSTSSFSSPRVLAMPTAHKLSMASPILMAAPRGRGGFGPSRNYTMPSVEEVRTPISASYPGHVGIACEVTVQTELDERHHSASTTREYSGVHPALITREVSTPRRASPPPFANFSLDGLRRALPRSANGSTTSLPPQPVSAPAEAPVFFGRGGAGRGTKINLKTFGKKKKAAAA